MGYVVSGGDLYDLTSLKKPIKKTQGLHISYLKVIMPGEETQDLTLEDARKKARVFVLAKEGENQFYMDLNGKKYLPKQA